MAGSWGAVAGALRFFADRFGIARASIEGTTLPYDLVSSYAVVGEPAVVLTGPRKHQRLALERRRSYFGFELDTEMEQLNGRIPEGLRDEAGTSSPACSWRARSVHPDTGRLKRAVGELDELWRRSGGTLPDLAPDAVRHRVLAQLGGVASWDDFQRIRIALDPATLVDQSTRDRLTALPGMVRVRGDAAPVEYELQDGEGVARIRLREGQAKRLRPERYRRSTGRFGLPSSAAATHRSWRIRSPRFWPCCARRPGTSERSAGNPGWQGNGVGGGGRDDGGGRPGLAMAAPAAGAELRVVQCALSGQ